jgi:predicted amidophosphoribosyltransferase
MLSLWTERTRSPSYCSHCHKHIIYIGDLCEVCYDIFVEAKIDQRREEQDEKRREIHRMIGVAD